MCTQTTTESCASSSLTITLNAMHIDAVASLTPSLLLNNILGGTLAADMPVNIKAMSRLWSSLWLTGCLIILHATFELPSVLTLLLHHKLAWHLQQAGTLGPMNLLQGQHGGS